MSHPARYSPPSPSARARRSALIALFLLMFGAIFSAGLAAFGAREVSEKGPELAEELGVPHPAVIAHRGASWDAPESTRPAFELARAVGADYLEADIQRTADGELVVFHDATLERTTNVVDIFPDRADDPVAEFTLEELEQLDHGSWFNEAFPFRARPSFEGLGPLTLEELIEIAEEGAHKPGLYLETKLAPRYPGIEEEIIETLEAAGWLPEGPGPENEIVPESDDLVTVAFGDAPVKIQSFHSTSVEQVAALSDDVIPVLLVNRGMALRGGFGRQLRIASRIGARAVAPNASLASARRISRAHRRGLLTHHYTVNDPDDMLALLSAGSDGIFTDRAPLALEKFERGPEVDVSAVLAVLGY